MSSWNWRIEVIIALILLTVLFMLGWWRLRQISRTTGRKHVALASAWRPVSYLGGMLLLVLALLSPIETLSGQLFSMHMVQHLLLGMFAPPLLLIANPMPIVMWGLPMNVRKGIGRIFFSRKSKLRSMLKTITQPAIIWFTFFVVLWGWHDANLYNLTLRSEWVHNFEHITFFATAMALWWHITGAAPHFHKRFSYPARVAFTITCVPANMILGVFIAFSTKVIYTYYETIPFRVFNISVLDDQTLGGVLMWVPGSMMYVIAVVVLIALWLNNE